jgi:hypothetical protein
LCVRTPECRLVRVGARDWRDPWLAPWWTGRSVQHRLLAHLTEQAVSVRISPGGHHQSDLVLERVVVWTRLGVSGTPGLPTRKQLRGSCICVSGRGEGKDATNAMCTQGCKELCTSQDVSPRLWRAYYRVDTPPVLCFALLTSSLSPSRQSSVLV